ncbi:hypothetical protein V6N13_078926 [Hibiscus sabdariffa]|uniref:Disease resistance N-terminal domain-containing protein n=1 Tax=Hibiscus sabdariffa TaxID=183260 RepID=A0ABR2RQ87_9ROSI
MAVADAVISFAVQKTGDLILQQAMYLTEVSGKVQGLRAELTRMRCFLRDAESRQGDSISIHNWVAEIRDIAYDAEDVLEIYALKDASRSIFSRCGIRWRDPISVYKVGEAIDGIAARLTDLTARLPAYGLKELQDEERAGSSSDKTFYRRTYSYKMEQNVVGLEEDTNLLLTQLRRTDCRVV